MKELRQAVEKLATEELERANEKFSLFNSPHEGIAIVFEEINECQDELRHIEESIKKAWNCIKKNKDAQQEMMDIEMYAIALACEGTQIAAMARKTICSSKKEKVSFPSLLNNF